MLITSFFLWLKARRFKVANHPAEHGIDLDVVVALRANTGANKSGRLCPLRALKAPDFPAQWAGESNKHAPSSNLIFGVVLGLGVGLRPRLRRNDGEGLARGGRLYWETPLT